jgi:hypothetical protein
MNFSLFSSAPHEPARCAFTKSHGHRCRMLPVNGSPYCPAHIPKPDSIASSDQLATADLLQAAGTFSSPEDVHRFLAQVTLQLIQDRISLKKAGLFSYLGQNILRAQREIAFHQKLKEDAQRHEEEESNEPYGTYEIPRPWRGEPGELPPSQRNTSDTAAHNSCSAIPTSEKPSTTDAAVNAPVKAEIPAASPAVYSSVKPTATLAAHSREHSSPAVPSAAPSAVMPAKPAPPPAKTQPPPEPPPPIREMRHFYPIDPTLHPSVIGPDPITSISHPDAAECRRRERLRGLAPAIYGRR